MLPLYRKGQFRRLDHLTAQALELDDFELMQKAGRLAAKTLQQITDADAQSPMKKILVLTGSGNNGGDGYVLALTLYLAGWPVTVWPQVPEEKLSPSAHKAFEQFKQAEGRLLPVGDDGRGDAENWQAQWLVDALLGTGINRPVSGRYAEAIDWINRQSQPVFSLDLPSGLDADTGAVLGRSVQATATITFIGLKPGLFTADGPDYCGELFFADLDAPPELSDLEHPAAWLLEAEDVHQHALRRAHNVHKGLFGHMVVIGGNHNMLGAALLSATAALRSGAGSVTLMPLSPERNGIALNRSEVMTSDPASAPALCARANVLAIGPGLGQNARAKSLFRQSLALAQKHATNCVLDADALNLLAKEVRLPRLPPNSVLTPHPKEAARLLHCDVAVIQSNRLHAAEELAVKYQCTVVLKGCGSVIAAPERKPVVCPFGTPGMATAGMGDVLTGVIAALLGQGLGAFQAAATGVLAHALAAEITGISRGLMASDVIDALPRIWDGTTTQAPP